MRYSARNSWLLLGPALALEVAVLFLPLIYIGFRSLYDWNPAGSSEFVGLENFYWLFTDPDFWEIVWNQLFYLLGLPLWVLAPLAVAYLLRDNVWCAGLFRSIYFLPAVMSPAIVGLMFRSLLSTDGTVNAALEGLGLGSWTQSWLTQADLVKPVIILMVLWAGFGTGVLIFTSAFAAVPRDLFEAAKLDGARFWQQFWYVAMPSIKNTVVLWTMYQIVAIFLFMFGWVYVLTGGGPGLASATMDFSIYQQFVRFGFYGTAAAQTVVLILSILLVPAIGYAGSALLRLLPTRKGRKGRKDGHDVEQKLTGAQVG